MRFLKAVQDRVLRNQCSAVGLGLFRIAYGSVLLGEVLQLIYFRRLVFGDLPYLPATESSFAYVLWAWAAGVVCLILGLYTRIACVANYVLTLATLSTFKHYEYHADHIYIGLNLLLIFTPVENCLSLDWLRRRIRSGALPGERRPDTRVVRFHYDALLLVGLGLVYLDSFFWKLGQEIWSNGLGVWLPASLPHDTWFSPAILNAVLNRRVLMGVLSDFTLVFEATFIGLMWLRAARPILCLIGLGLHVSIALAFPIPFFGLSLAAIYLLLAPPAWYEAVGRALRRRAPACVVYFDAELPQWRRLLLILEHFDFRGCLEFRPVASPASGATLSQGLLVVEEDREYGGEAGFVAALRCHSLFWPFAGLHQIVGSWYRGSSVADLQHARPRTLARHVDLNKLVHVTATPDLSGGDSINRAREYSTRRIRPDAPLRFKFAVVAFCVIVQLTLIAQAPYFRDAGTPPSASSRWLAQIQSAANGLAGVCSHGVFLDDHFNNYDHIIAVAWTRPDGTEQWLPLTRPNGQMGWYATGRFWCKWVFRGNGPHVSLEHLKVTLRDVTGFWARKNRVDLTDARFKVLVRKYDPQNGWQRDYLLRQIEKPWTQIEVVRWKDKEFSAQIADIESI